MDRRLLILWLTIFVDLIGFTLFIPVVPYFAADVGVDETMVMLSIAAFSMMVFLCSPTVSYTHLSERHQEPAP